jgi:hypothetical protein
MTEYQLGDVVTGFGRMTYHVAHVAAFYASKGIWHTADFYWLMAR